MQWFGAKNEDGILGIGADRKRDPSSHFIYSLYTKGLIDKPMISFVLGNVDDGRTKATIGSSYAILGGIDKEFY